MHENAVCDTGAGFPMVFHSDPHHSRSRATALVSETPPIALRGVAPYCTFLCTHVFWDFSVVVSFLRPHPLLVRGVSSTRALFLAHGGPTTSVANTRKSPAVNDAVDHCVLFLREWWWGRIALRGARICCRTNARTSAKTTPPPRSLGAGVTARIAEQQGIASPERGYQA